MPFFTGTRTELLQTWRCCRLFLGVLTLVTVVLLFNCRKTVRFDEMAFRKPFFQELDQSRVYEQGVYYALGTMVTFKAQVQDAFLSDLAVFSKADGDDAGTPLVIDIGIQYKLQPSGLSEIYDIGGENGYATQIVAVVTDVIKNNATHFNADAYLTNRRQIEKSFTENVRKELLEKFADTQLYTLQLLQVDFPASFFQRKLDVGIQEIRNQIQEFNRQSTVVRDETERRVVVIENRAKEVVEVTKAEAALLTQKAANQATRIKGSVDGEAVKLLADSLNITEQKDFLSLNYLVEILSKPSGLKKFVNFNNLPEAKSLI